MTSLSTLSQPSDGGSRRAMRDNLQGGFTLGAGLGFRGLGFRESPQVVVEIAELCQASEIFAAPAWTETISRYFKQVQLMHGALSGRDLQRLHAYNSATTKFQQPGQRPLHIWTASWLRVRVWMNRFLAVRFMSMCGRTGFSRAGNNPKPSTLKVKHNKALHLEPLKP